MWAVLVLGVEPKNNYELQTGRTWKNRTLNHSKPELREPYQKNPKSPNFENYFGQKTGQTQVKIWKNELRTIPNTLHFLPNQNFEPSKKIELRTF